MNGAYRVCTCGNNFYHCSNESHKYRGDLLCSDQRDELRGASQGYCEVYEDIVCCFGFFVFTGQLLFLIFNITVAAFKIAGGILLVTSAFSMLNPRKKEFSGEELENISIVPLAFPLTAGPGTIMAVILLVSEASSLLEASLVFVGIFAGVLVSYLGMTYAPRIFKFLGEEGLHVVTRLMSIIVLAIAVQFVINGIAETIPTL